MLIGKAAFVIIIVGFECEIIRMAGQKAGNSALQHIAHWLLCGRIGQDALLAIKNSIAGDRIGALIPGKCCIVSSTIGSAEQRGHKKGNPQVFGCTCTK